MLHVTITEGTKVLLNEDYEAFICTGVNDDEGDAHELAEEKTHGQI